MPQQQLKPLLAASVLDPSDKFIAASQLVIRTRDDAKRSIGTPREAEAHKAWAKAIRELRQLGRARQRDRASDNLRMASSGQRRLLH